MLPVLAALTRLFRMLRCVQPIARSLGRARARLAQRLSPPAVTVRLALRRVQLAVTRPAFGGISVGWELASAMVDWQHWQRPQARRRPSLAARRTGRGTRRSRCSARRSSWSQRRQHGKIDCRHRPPAEAVAPCATMSTLTYCRTSRSFHFPFGAVCSLSGTQPEISFSRLHT